MLTDQTVRTMATQHAKQLQRELPNKNPFDVADFMLTKPTMSESQADIYTETFAVAWISASVDSRRNGR